MVFKKISVVGLGYIGLPTAAMFAAYGQKVVGVDVNPETVDIINRGNIHIIEPDLDKIVFEAVKKSNLKAVLKPEAADVFIIAVPTPFLAEKNESGIPSPDLKYIRSAAMNIAPVLKKGDLIILESTSPVGATEQMANWFAELRPELSFPQQIGENSDIRIAHCPERVLPGRVVKELVENDRVIGGMTNRCSELAIELYSIFVKGNCVITNARTAEMAKLTENSCRDVQIAFANELSIICDELDIDVWELISLANRHPRINILSPGPGVGGHCIAVDPWFVVSKTPELAKLIHTARKVNDGKPEWVINKVKIAVADFLQANPNKSSRDVSIACYGLAFKADIDDLRESPALDICQKVAKLHSGTTFGVEPNIDKLPNNIEGVVLVNLDSALERADIHLMLVDHKEFISNNSLSNKVIIDTKGIW